MKVQTNPNQTNPKPNQGMEIFLTQSPSPNPQVKTNQSMEEQPKQIIKINKKEEIQTNLNKYDEIEENIRKIEEQLMKSKTLDITTFNKLVYTKHLKFKLLLIRSRIYVVITDGQKTTSVAIEAPRWGGSSLRYMITSCTSDWCQVVEKSTSKGKILSYQPLTLTSTETDNSDDIFD